MTSEHDVTENNVFSRQECVLRCVQLVDFRCRSVQYNDNKNVCEMSLCTRHSCLSKWQKIPTYDHVEITYVPSKSALLFVLIYFTNNAFLKI